MAATDDVARMLALVPWLLERPGADLDEIAEAFGVDQATIRDDLGHLDFCGLPGLGGGDLFEVSIVGDRVVVRMADELRRPLRLTPREALRLVLAVDAVAGAIGEELPSLRSALEKVRHAAGVPPGATVQLEDDGSQCLGVLRDAIADDRQVLLDYQGRADSRPRRRHVDPWALHVSDGRWYLQGHDHDAGDRRTFRLDRVAACEPGAEPRSARPDGPLPAPRYVPGDDDVAVELELAPSARWLADVVDVDERHEVADGGLIVHLRTDASTWLARLVLSAGGDARVRAPATLRAEVVALAEEAVARHR